MRASDDRILTTHVGSLPRNPALRDLLVRQDRGEPIDEAALAREVEAAVHHVVRGSAADRPGAAPRRMA
jgi:5-methyltetrahydropteroyltriglutamate--homocysteine methyltransferase